MDEDMKAVDLATELTVAWLSNPNTRVNADDVPAFLQSMHTAVQKLASPQEPPPEVAPVQEFTGAVTARKSLASPDHIISMIDGKPYRTLRRHLKTNGLTPEQYRERYKLKADYPMVAPSYSDSRRAIANKIGLGRKAGQKVAKAVADTGETVVKTARKGARAAKQAAHEHLVGGE